MEGQSVMASLKAFYDQETHKVVEILKLARPAKIIRFGSIARGEVNEESDLDLCVLIDTGGQPAFRIKQALYKLLFEHGYEYPLEVDVHVYSPAEYRDLLEQEDFFVQEIARGEVLYEE